MGVRTAESQAAGRGPTGQTPHDARASTRALSKALRAPATVAACCPGCMVPCHDLSRLGPTRRAVAAVGAWIGRRARRRDKKDGPVVVEHREALTNGRWST